MEDFQNNIKQWVHYDNETHRLHQALKKVREQKNKYLENFSTPIDLKPNNLYIVRIELKDGIKTFKILSN